MSDEIEMEEIPSGVKKVAQDFVQKEFVPYTESPHQPMYTTEQLAKVALSALTSKDIVFLSETLWRISCELKEEKKGTKWLNNHPIVQLLTQKMRNLTHPNPVESTMDRMERVVRDLAHAEVV